MDGPSTSARWCTIDDRATILLMLAAAALTATVFGRPDDANLAGASAISTDFLRGYALGDRKAIRRISTAPDTASVKWTRRRARRDARG